MKRAGLYIIFFASLFLVWQCKAPEIQTASAKSKMIYKVLKSTNATEKTFNTLLTNPKRGTNAVSKEKFNRKLLVDERIVEGFKVLTVQNSTSVNRHIIFLHGGAYIAEANAAHRTLIEDLVRDYHFKVTFIDYPLAPEHQAPFTLEIVAKAFAEISKACPDDEFYLFGDSAGGGLALAFLQHLRNNKSPGIPTKTVLQSPWLDISMSNPEIEPFIEKDVLLQFESLKECGKLYAGDLDLKDPLVSPIYGNLENLCKIKVFVSTHELFYPDCMRLKNLLDTSSGSSIDLTIKEEMIHDWILLPIKEREETLQEIAAFYLND